MTSGGLAQSETAAANAKELYFDLLDSGYWWPQRVHERSAALFHGSEVAFWPNAESHIEGIGQAIADVPGTESILESTANGIGNLFYSLWTAAQAGESEYEAIFLPWHLHEEYGVQPPADWTVPEEFRNYAGGSQPHTGSTPLGLVEKPRPGRYHRRPP